MDLFGVPQQLYNFKGTYSDLEIDSDDLSVYIAKYPTLLAEVHLDYFGRGYRRSIELFCRDEREIEYFTDYALGDEQQSCNPPALALDVLKLTLGEH